LLSSLKEGEDLAAVVSPVFEGQFTPEDLQREWECYAKQAGEEGRPAAAALLSMVKPEIVEGKFLQVTLENQTQHNTLMDVRQGLLGHLHKALANNQLDLKIEVMEKAETVLRYTAQEKYEYMVSKNPLLAELRNALNADIE
jgi:DNA polymerase-3 subunit gamma/tau